jgi:hypothetical protein
MKQPTSRLGKGMIAAAALGLGLALTAGAIILAMASQPAPPPRSNTPPLPDAYEDFGPAVDAFAIDAVPGEVELE